MQLVGDAVARRASHSPARCRSSSNQRRSSARAAGLTRLDAISLEVLDPQPARHAKLGAAIDELPPLAAPSRPAMNASLQ